VPALVPLCPLFHGHPTVFRKVLRRSPRNGSFLAIQHVKPEEVVRQPSQPVRVEGKIEHFSGAEFTNHGTRLASCRCRWQSVSGGSVQAFEHHKAAVTICGHMTPHSQFPGDPSVSVGLPGAGTYGLTAARCGWTPECLRVERETARTGAETRNGLTAEDDCKRAPALREKNSRTGLPRRP
jgi:hypothetical protein